MIKENQRFLNQLHVFSDGVIIFLSMLISYWLRFSLLSGTKSMPFHYYIWLGAAAAILCVLSFATASLYESYRAIRFYRESGRLLAVNALDTVILIAGLFAFHMDDMSRLTIVIFYPVSSFLLLAKRAALRSLLHRYRSRGYNLKHVIIVGGGQSAEEYLHNIRTDSNLGYTADGYVSDDDWEALPRRGGYDELESVLEVYSPDEVVVALPSADDWRMPKVITQCEKTGTKVSVIPFYADYLPSNPQVDNIDGLLMINVRRIPIDNMGNAFIKRLEDIVGSLLLIIISSPLMLITAIGVKLSSPGPVIFKQERVGKDKKNFYMYKFRSMKVNASEKVGWSTVSDDRRTKFGSFIRKYSLDELPQFFNVLVGDMSLVGPRPEVPYHVERFRETIPRYMVKHQVRPGITGWAQVNGLRGDTSISDRIEYDLYYIENWNILFDVKILLMTLFRIRNKEKLGAGV